MKKYLEVFRTTFEEYFTYRLDFFMWRFREILGLLILYFFWTAVYDQKDSLFGYTQIQMVTYILASSLMQNFIMATRTMDVGDEIETGHIINLILKPISFFKYHVTRDAADKAINLLFGVIEISLLIFIFKPALLIQSDPLTLLTLVVMVVLGAFIGFFIYMMFSFLAFWTTETWAPAFIFNMLVSFLAGGYFPLDILPKPFFNLLLLTPFPYMYYLPAKTYVSGLSTFSIVGLFVCAGWVFIFYHLARLMWRRGLKSYTFFGQ